MSVLRMQCVKTIQGFILVGGVCYLSSACQNFGDRSTNYPDTSPTPQVTSTIPRPNSQTTSASNPPDAFWESRYQQAVSQAASAQSIAGTAVSPDDWQLVKSQWQSAIQLLQSIPASHSRHADAIALIASYQQQLARLPTGSAPPPAKDSSVEDANPSALSTERPSTSDKGMVILPGKASGTTLTFADTGSADPPTFEMKVKRWIQKRPLIDVTFNQSVQFEMVVDPDASTTQITPASAQLLELSITQQVVSSDADRSGLAGQSRVSSVEFAGVTLNNLLVTVGNEKLKLGVLGKDVLGNFQVSTDENNVKLVLR